MDQIQELPFEEIRDIPDISLQSIVVVLGSASSQGGEVASSSGKDMYKFSVSFDSYMYLSEQEKAVYVPKEAVSGVRKNVATKLVIEKEKEVADAKWKIRELDA